jgi:hypothetical protein
MYGRKKESYVSYIESGSRSISSGVPIKEFMTRCWSGKFALASTDAGRFRTTTGFVVAPRRCYFLLYGRVGGYRGSP